VQACVTYVRMLAMHHIYISHSLFLYLAARIGRQSDRGLPQQGLSPNSGIPGVVSKSQGSLLVQGCLNDYCTRVIVVVTENKKQSKKKAKFYSLLSRSLFYAVMVVYMVQFVPLNFVPKIVNMYAIRINK